MATASITYPLFSARLQQASPPENLRLERDRLRRENEALKAVVKEGQAIAAEIALNPFAEIDELRPRASRLLALQRQLRAVVSR